MEDLVPKPDAMKPPVWAYFGFVAGADGKTANKEKPVCKECGQTVATKGSNTSNLLSHLRNSHPTIYSRIKGGETFATKQKWQTEADAIGLIKTSCQSIWWRSVGFSNYCISATRSYSEHLFSTAGNVVTKKDHS